MLKSCTLALLLALPLAAPAMGSDITYPAAPPSPGWGEVSGAYLGVDVQEVTSDRVAALKLKEERGAEITMVDHDAPAGKAGLREHDVILQFNGTPIEGTEELRRLIHETPPGRNVRLLISRDGQPITINVQLADKKQYFAQYPKKLEAHEMPPIPPIPPIPPMPDLSLHLGSTYGVTVDSLTPQLGEYFGVKNGAGVLVRSVEKGSPAAAAGLKAGDVIVRVGDSRIADRSDWRAAIRSHRSGKVRVGIVRDRREQTLTINLVEAKQDQSYFDLPDFDFDMNLDLDLSTLEARLQELRPELERARREGMVQAQRALKQGRKQMDAAARQTNKAIEVNQKEIRKALEEARIALDREMKRYEKELEKARGTWE